LPAEPARAHTLDGHAPPDIVGDEQTLQYAAVASRFERRYLEGHGLETASGSYSQRKRARALCQRAKRRSLRIEYLDPSDMTVGIRI
jgi:hypothetical protein